MQRNSQGLDYKQIIEICHFCDIQNKDKSIFKFTNLIQYFINIFYQLFFTNNTLTFVRQKTWGDS